MNLSSMQHLLDKALELAVPVESISSAMGGSINESYLVSLSDGRRLFIKTHRREAIAGMYAAEKKALELLASTRTLAVPAALYQDEDFLVMEAFAPGRPDSDWQEQMGRGLAQLHYATRQRQSGFECDNFLGTSLQRNQWQDDWISFWREQRLGFQFNMMKEHLPVQDPLLRATDKLMECLDQLLACDTEPAVLLHGDLWSGNTAANQEGKPVIFDPASYFGTREAEFGMMRLFGGFGSHCEGAYQEVWPFQPGHNQRISVYRLYHQLNHLNIFGSSYYQASLESVRNLI